MQDTKFTADAVRIEIMDNWHRNWPAALSWIEQQGDRPSLMLDEDGWLSARQVLLVAYVQEAVKGYICFRVQPLQTAHGVARGEDGRVRMEAVIDAMKVDAPAVQPPLLDAATRRAAALNCAAFRNRDSSPD